MPGAELFSAGDVLNAAQGPGRAALTALVVLALCSGDGTGARDVFHASVQTQYEMKNSYPRTRPE